MTATDKPVLQGQNLVALISIDGIGPKTLFLIKNYLNKTRTSWDQFWVGGKGLWHKIGLNNKVVASIKKFKKEHTIYSYWQSLKDRQVSVLTFWDEAYPKLLKEIDDPPPVLFVKGSLNLLKNWSKHHPIAMVGTRRMTAYGKMVTKKIATELALAGATVVSGFMYGVDVTAQKAAVKAGAKTVGVLGFGFNHMVPRRHQSIFDKFLKQGNCFVTEFAPHVPPSAGTFRRRNRIVAGLSLGVIVTEAAVKSGTQITVGYALDYGREVFAVPGSINNPYSEGTRYMINQGAMLINSAQEVLNNLALGQLKNVGANSPANQVKATNCEKINLTGLSQLERSIVAQLQNQMLNTEQLSDLLKIPLPEVASSLSLLEIKGLIQREANQWHLVYGKLAK